MRTSWDSYFIEIAKTVSTRSTCSRLKVGAVIVKDKNILSTGFNGSISGQPHCIDIGCDDSTGSCQRTIHAEVNAILQAAKNGVAINQATMYVTHIPCPTCYKLICNSGISNVVYLDDYRIGLNYYIYFYGTLPINMTKLS